MRKITFLFVLVLAVSFSYAQRNSEGKLNLKTKNFAARPIQQSTQTVANASIATTPVKSISSLASESFEGTTFPPTGWTKQSPDGGSGWAMDTVGTSYFGWTPATNLIFAAPGGGNQVAYGTYANGGASSDDMWLITPQFSVTAGEFLNFWSVFPMSYKDTLEIYISTTTNAVASFTTRIGKIGAVSQTAWVKSSIDLSAYASQSIYIGFREYIADNQTNGGWVGLDLVEVSAPLASDAGIYKISGVETGCGLTSNNVIVDFVNFGSTTITSCPLNYKVNNGAVKQGTYTGSLAPGDTASFTFTPAEDFSALGTYSITAYTALVGDGSTANDTAHLTIANVAPSTAPYSMGFESTEDLLGLNVIDANNDGTSWGVYSGALYAHTGTNFTAYTYTSANAANDWIFTKCLDLNAGTNYQLDFWFRVASSNYPENLLAAIGSAQTAASMTTTLVDLPALTDTVYNDTAKVFTVPTTGTYYIGFKAYSAADMYNIYLDDISISIATSLKETSNATETSVYPNPAKNNINVISAESIKSVKLINAIGQTVVNEEVNAKTVSINTSSLVRGIYFVKVQTNNRTTTKRISIIE